MKPRHSVRFPAVFPIAAVFLLAIPATTAAAIIPPECRFGGSGCTICHMAVGIINLTNFLMKDIAFPAAVLLVTVGGIMLLVSGPSEPRRTLAKQILTSTVIGLIIILLAWIGVDTIIKVLTGSFNFGGEPGSLLKNFTAATGRFGPWNQIPIEQCKL